MIGILFAAVLAIAPAWTPGPTDPVCEPGQVSWVDHCYQGQLPGEVIGRETGDGPFPSAVQTSPAPATSPGLAPATATQLAHTGVRTAPYLVASGSLIAGGSGLVLIRRRRLAR